MNVKHRIITDTVSPGIYIPLRLRSAVTRSVVETLRAEQVACPCLVAVHFSDDRFIHGANLDYRGVDRATDVLSFPSLELFRGDKPEPDETNTDSHGRVMLGEMILSLERAAEQAEEYGHSIERELGFLAVHSTLHLLGYDHELDEDEEIIHFARQEAILAGMGLKR